MTATNAITGSLGELIAKLESNPLINNAFILDVLAESGIGYPDVEPYCFYNHPETESYGRREIYRSDRLRIFVLSWNPGDFTAIHDHEPAEWGAVQFFGDMSHRLYSVENNQVSLVKSDSIHSGQMVGVSGNLIHSMGNLTVVPALTLHIYGTNSQYNSGFNTRIFDLEIERVVMTDGPAYLNRSASNCKILSEPLFAEGETLTDYARNTSLWRNRKTH